MLRSSVKTGPWEEVERRRVQQKHGQSRKEAERRCPGFPISAPASHHSILPKPEGKGAQVRPLAGSAFCAGQRRMENRPEKEGRRRSPAHILSE